MCCYVVIKSLLNLLFDKRKRSTSLILSFQTFSASLEPLLKIWSISPALFY